MSDPKPEPEKTGTDEDDELICINCGFPGTLIAGLCEDCLVDADEEAEEEP